MSSRRISGRSACGYGMSASWSQLSGVNPEYHLSADLDDDNADEIMADFGALGLWLWDGGAWSQISANDPD